MAFCGADSIDTEHVQHLKKKRANAKRELTKVLNRVADCLTTEQTIDDVRVAEAKLNETFENFKVACQEYKAVMVDEDDIEECLAYTRS